MQSKSISYKLLEQACLTDYRNNNNDALPEWNEQEQGKDCQMILKMSMPIPLKKLKTEKRLSIERRLTNLAEL
ncbi:hypothetical protein NP05261_03790 [Helicobacter pylori]